MNNMMNTILDFRTATSTDIPEASEFVLMALNDIGMQNDCVELLGSEFTNRLQRFPQNTLLAFDKSNNEAIIGFLEIDPDKSSPGNYFIKNLYVLPAYRKKGIASNLVSRMIQEKCTSGDEVHVEVCNENDRRYWEKLQFETKGMVLSLKK